MSTTKFKFLSSTFRVPFPAQLVSALIKVRSCQSRKFPCHLKSITSVKALENIQLRACSIPLRILYHKGGKEAVNRIASQSFRLQSSKDDCCCCCILTGKLSTALLTSDTTPPPLLQRNPTGEGGVLFVEAKRNCLEEKLLLTLLLWESVYRLATAQRMNEYLHLSKGRNHTISAKSRLAATVRWESWEGAQWNGKTRFPQDCHKDDDKCSALV